MKIGILTYHSEINYGSTLQAFAMQEIYRELGHDPIIIDRYITPDNSLLLGPLARTGLRNRIRNFILGIFGVGTRSMIKRVKKTLAFHKKYLNKTPYSFYNCEDAPSDLGVDMISVGSDQIWNANLYSPLPYLLKWVDKKIPAISYAASIGMPQLSPRYLNDYKEGFARFKAISVREKQGVQLVKEMGFEATQVVDPTLLINPEIWEKFKGTKKTKRRKLICYTLSEDLLTLLPILEKFSKENNCDVVLFPDRYEKWDGLNAKGIANTLRLQKRLQKSPVKIYISAAIKEFLNEISTATWIVTNSYHALMFSVIYRKNVRIIVPSNTIRKGMHARMEEFSDSIITGPLMQNDIDCALLSCSRGESIHFNEEILNNRIEDSKMWLKQQLDEISNNISCQ